MQHLGTISVDTEKELSFIDVTCQVREIIKQSKIQEGLVTLFTQHTTTAIHINENEPHLQRDMIRSLLEILPENGSYNHDVYSVDGRPNAKSHLMAMLLRSSETIPIAKGEMLLGRWQSIFFVELDGPRSGRNVLVSVLGA